MLDDFVHLHVHSEFSLWTASRARGDDQRAADLGMKAPAVTDHGAMYGTIEFYSAAKAAGIKPIIGIEQYIAPRGMADKEGAVPTIPHGPARQERGSATATCWR